MTPTYIRYCLKQRMVIRLLPTFLLVLGTLSAQPGPTPDTVVRPDDLAARFQNPPREARIGAFWFWPNTVTRAGITRDLEEMKHAGLGRVVLSQTRAHGGTVDQGGTIFLSPEWLALFRHALDEAARLELKVSAVMGNGWYQGGPWVTPDLGAQMLVWSQTEVSGPQPVSVRLAEPDRCRQTGPFSRISPKAKGHMKPVAVLACRQNEAGELLQQTLLRLDNETAPDGTLTWKAPAGKWVVFRFAHAPNFVPMKQDSPGYGGLQIDHLSAKAIEIFFEKVGRPMLAAAGPHVGKTLDLLHEDSIELGHYDWTPDFAAQFLARRGYDLIPWLPALTGSRFAGLSAADGIEHDFDATIDELLTDEHYKTFRDLCHRQGVKLETEGGDVRGSIAVKGVADFPMGEFWNHTREGSDLFTAFYRNTIFASHVYGQNIASFESFTTSDHWEEFPAMLKPKADRVFCLGVNHLMLHGYSYSRPETPRPGDIYFAGTHFDPGITWWTQAGSFFKYLNRCQAMLTAGRAVADILYVDGPETQAMILKDEALTRTALLGYDVAPAELIASEAKVLPDGRVALASGATYPVLAIANRTVAPAVLRQIVRLVKDGATLWMHTVPQSAPGWADAGQAARIIQECLAELGAGRSDGIHAVGKGRVIIGSGNAEEVLAAVGIAPDFQYQAQGGNPFLGYTHRQVGDADVYFVANREGSWKQAQVSFRVGERRRPELWNPVNGEIRPCVDYQTAAGEIMLPLRLPPNGSTFVVFRNEQSAAVTTKLTRDGRVLSAGNPAEDVAELSGDDQGGVRVDVWKAGAYTIRTGGRSEDLVVNDLPSPLELTVRWSVRFNPARDGQSGFETSDSPLSLWNESPDPRLKSFAGTAVYQQDLTLPPGWLDRTKRVFIDLGEVHDLAEISVNGKSTGVVWTAPFRVDVTDLLVGETNRLEIRVTNTWHNWRLATGYLPVKHPWSARSAGHPPLKAGLVGPVRLICVERRMFSPVR